MLNEGDRAPDFELPADDGSTVKLSDFKGRKVVLYFYPKDDTPGCTKEACAFRDLRADFDGLGVRVFGISADSVKAQGNFRDKYELTMPLLSDPDKTVLTPWGIWGEKKNYGRTYMGIIRTTVMFDADGKVAHVWPKVRVKGHVDAVLEKARELFLWGGFDADHLTRLQVNFGKTLQFLWRPLDRTVSVRDINLRDFSACAISRVGEIEGHAKGTVTGHLG